MKIEYEGAPGERQTGKTTRALKECQALSQDGCNAIYVAHTAEMAHCAPRLLGETPRFLVTYPTRELPRGIRPTLAVIDCYDILKPKVRDEIEASLRIMGTQHLRLIHSGVSR